MQETVRQSAVAVRQGVGAGASGACACACEWAWGGHGRMGQMSAAVQGHSRHGGGSRGSCCGTAHPHRAWRGPNQAATAARGARRGAPPHPQAPPARAPASRAAAHGGAGAAAQRWPAGSGRQANSPRKRCVPTWLEKEGSSWGGYEASTLARAEGMLSRLGRPAVSKLMRAEAGAEGEGGNTRGQRAVAEWQEGSRLLTRRADRPRQGPLCCWRAAGGGWLAVPAGAGRARGCPERGRECERQAQGGSRRAGAGGRGWRQGYRQADRQGARAGQTLTDAIQPAERGHTLESSLGRAPVGAAACCSCSSWRRCSSAASRAARCRARACTCAALSATAAWYCCCWAAATACRAAACWLALPSSCSADMRRRAASTDGRSAACCPRGGSGGERLRACGARPACCPASCACACCWDAASSAAAAPSDRRCSPLLLSLPLLLRSAATRCCAPVSKDERALSRDMRGLTW